MTRPRRLLLLLAPAVTALWLCACGTMAPVVHTWEREEQATPGACEEPGADRCVVMACDEGTCGLFACEDVDATEVAPPGVELAQGRPPIRGSGRLRDWWQRTGVRGGARPLATLPAPMRRSVFVPAIPLWQGRFIKHHLFPQEPRLAAYFRAAGVDIHQFTMVIPEYIHRQIHSGRGMGPGGAWNDAWRQFVRANPRPPSREVLMRHALELAFRFELSGPVVPYNSKVVPQSPGPRIEAY